MSSRANYSHLDISRGGMYKKLVWKVSIEISVTSNDVKLEYEKNSLISNGLNSDHNLIIFVPPSSCTSSGDDGTL